MATIGRCLRVVQHERANFFATEAKLGCDPFSRRAFGVVGGVLLVSFANVRVLSFAEGYLPEFGLALFFFGELCFGFGGRGPQAHGIRRPW